MSTVLLFGANGFLGRHVRDALAPHASLVCPGRADCDLSTADVAQLTDLVRGVRPTAVVNCTGRLDGSAEQLLQAHTLVTARLVDAVAQAAPGARLVRLGSAGEYGQVPVGRSVSESDPARPLGAYGLSHLTATRLMELAAGRLDAVVLRVFNPIGPGLPATGVLGRVARLLADARRSGAHRIELGPLHAYRDFVDVRDVALAVRAAVLAPPLPRVVYNIGSGTAVSVREVVNALAAEAGFAGTVAETSPAPGAERSAGVPWIRADVTAARRHLGWSPLLDLAETLRAVWTEASDEPSLTSSKG
ncbi:NAD-dependent epimerase/dehydratase family protein [Micromonospora robiginosa]|uniref:NAD-dependent epimerase/dehydratase family protein n=1 Tax=Micromonospora robiginosa TaxID=2749844 RepID=A0A7L6AZ81_9ACTN|nr:NAD-dependent epimerase/dehydratase family protein [Micromonospora ferruginea]QLQ35059.1 NAD-dependent epimerase/dehydratase family protein [Micromonospora ferruginea]